MEYHEFTVLFTLPLTVACAWILWNYGDAILEKNSPGFNSYLRGFDGNHVFAMGGMVSGLGVAKI
jgi:hypothetical protein